MVSIGSTVLKKKILPIQKLSWSIAAMIDRQLEPKLHVIRTLYGTFQPCLVSIPSVILEKKKIKYEQIINDGCHSDANRAQVFSSVEIKT